jgi:hypothetical protein
MAIQLLSRITRRVLATVACTCAALAFGVAQAGPGGGGGQPPRCTIIAPADGFTINVGGSVQFSAVIDRDSPPYTVIWDYVGGDDLDADGDGNGDQYVEQNVPVNGTVTTPPVFYNTPGQFQGIVVATGNTGRSCNAQTVNITVSAGVNEPPVANDDAYDTLENDILSVAAPGVLQNDSDDLTPPSLLTATLVQDAGKGELTLNSDGSFTYDYTGPALSEPTTDFFTYNATDDGDPPLTSDVPATVTITISPEAAVTARGDAYATPIGKTLDVTATRVSGVLYNDFGGTPPYTAINLDTTGTTGTINLNADGSFTYIPSPIAVDNEIDTFTYQAEDAAGNLSAPATVAVQILSDQPDYKMTMNYELGMHCTGFEFAYCCVLPPYNSIVAQITKPQTAPTVSGQGGEPDPGSNGVADQFPRLLDATEDPATKDGLGRETVLRDLDLDGAGNFKRYQVKYFHDAQPRAEGQGKPQTSTLVSDVEGNSLLYTASRGDSAAIGANGELIYGTYGSKSGGPAVAYGVWQGDDCPNGDVANIGQPGCNNLDDFTDNYANMWLNHFYIYADLEGTIPPGSNSQEANKIRLGVENQVMYPKNVGASLQPMGPAGNVSGFDNVLTFSTDTGTVVYTQMKVLEDLPVMLTSPRLWEALGLPLTPFEDTIDFFGDPGLVDEDSIRPYVAMKGQLVEYPSGNAVIGSNGQPVIGFGTAPIDIPNCERCHSAPSLSASGQPNINSPSWLKRAGGPDPWGDPFGTGFDLEGLTDLEYNYWVAFYNIVPGVDADWYPRLKAAAINMLAIHDDENGTGFTENYPGCDSDAGTPDIPDCLAPPDAQNSRLGFETVICQKCHADNVIAVVKSGCAVDPSPTVLCPDDTGPGTRKIIQPITEAIHWNHRGTNECTAADGCGVVSFSDSLGRDGGCQGCHPAHRSDGVTDDYPITLDGANEQAGSDNRLAAGGCFVGRDVHSNPLKDVDGAETPEYLNAVGQWLQDNVSRNQAGLGNDADPTDFRGIWCTNCHNQLSQSIWDKENMVDLINGIPGKEADLETDAVNIRALPTLAQIAAAVGTSEQQAIAWLDPTDTNPVGDFTHSIWNPDIAANPDALVATIEVSLGDCGPRFPFPVPRFGVNACLDFDGDPGGAVGGAGDPSVRILDFCTTPDCVTLAQQVLDAEGHGSIAAPVPFDAATDGRDHWLSPGEPHCADCHAAPFTEQSGNINPFPPFNYPRKASLMRYSRGHQDITCQGCHESIHGLYPVSPTIDSTSYAQAASLNPDGSHGPLKCATCHETDEQDIPLWIRNGLTYNGQRVNNIDTAIQWMHTYTDEASTLQPGGVCENCHKDRSDRIDENSGKWLRHAYFGRVGRKTQDKAEIEALGYVAGDPDTDGDGTPDRTAEDIANTMCSSCHQLNGGPSGGFLSLATCENETWKRHLIQGRISEHVWEFISEDQNGSTCGW